MTDGPVLNVGMQGARIERLDEHDYERAFDEAFAVKDAGSWAIGDVAAYIDDMDGKDACKPVIESMRGEWSKVRNTRRISQVWPYEDRVYENCGYSHYQATASIADEHDRKTLMKKANDNGWTRAELRDAVKEYRGEITEEEQRPVRVNELRIVRSNGGYKIDLPQSVIEQIDALGAIKCDLILFPAKNTMADKQKAA